MSRFARNRIDPWHELQLAAQTALRGGSPAAVKLAADRVKFVPPVGRDYIGVWNALKALAYVWPHAPAGTEPFIREAVEKILSVLELWPDEDRLTYLAAVTLNTNQRKAS